MTKQSRETKMTPSWLFACSVLRPLLFIMDIKMHTRHPSFLVFLKTSVINYLKSIKPTPLDRRLCLIFYFLAEIGLRSYAEPLFFFFMTSNLLLEEIHLLQSSQNTVLMATILK